MRHDNVWHGSPSAPATPASAKEAGLRHVGDHIPGIRRNRAGKHFSYRDAQGERIDDPKLKARIRKLAIPPAWKNVWICPQPNGHLQATGIDARGRKQYRYHPRWRAVRDETKYGRMIAFGHALPAIRARVEMDLGRHGLPREKILAAIVRLLETTLIRIGNRAYARENASFGLTTLRNRHVTVEGRTIHFEFRAKSGKMRRLDLQDHRLARLMKQCRDLPGHELFQYVDCDGGRRRIASDDVNAYLKDASGADFTAKDFRTWAGTVSAALALRDFAPFESEAGAKRNINRAVELVAEKLANTVAICRKCYIHPEVFNAYLAGALDLTRHASISGLSADETAVLAFLESRRDDAR
jgi:DNA topoisomerase-1